MNQGLENITWRELTGNKFNKSLHPNMLLEEGLVRQTYIRRTGEGMKTLFNITYDREYVIGYLDKFVCSKLFVLGREKTLELVKEAWDTYYSDTPVRARLDRRAS